MTGEALAGWTVSLDMWGTLIDHTDKDAVAAWRVAEFARVFDAFGHRRTLDEVRAAVSATDQDVLRQQRRHGVQPVLDDMLAAIRGPLDIPDTLQMTSLLRVVHTHAALRGCPQPLQGAVETLTALSMSGARLVLTSNTLATSAEVHRQLLHDLGLSVYFADMLFSGELGIAKPHPDVFAAITARAQCPPERVWHVGDDRRTDVNGALTAGCRAVHYRPDGEAARGEVPVITHLGQLVDLLTTACQRAGAGNLEES
ncbi:HAD family hydrolase [Micromonospora sp. NPDC050980]|uniref:HAD family hydrolase n=1 Tax=Micromonospora sp. NPDC050980 TaxID=3155161 RepID=UPI0034081836